MKRQIVLGLSLVLAAAASWLLLTGRETEPVRAAGGALVEVVLPDLTGPEALGAQAFAAKCAECHGENGAGRDGKGPPLVHKIYEPSHHGDGAILNAVRNGAQGHHWPFGDMQPVEGLTDAEIGTIIAFIRKVQAANGIQ